MTTDNPILAAISVTDSTQVDELLADLSDHLRSQGLRIAGYLQRDAPDPESCCSASYLQDVASGEKRRITQPLGSGSQGCRLDPGALAEATAELLTQLNSLPDIVILNRFGRGESEGRGFRPVIETAYAMNIPVLTAVRERYQDSFQNFAADMALQLPQDRNIVNDWVQSVLPAVNDHDNPLDCFSVCSARPDSQGNARHRP